MTDPIGDIDNQHGSVHKQERSVEGGICRASWIKPKLLTDLIHR